MLIFTSIALAAFLLVAGSFFFGHEHDSGHDHGDAGHDVGDDSNEATVGIFSTKVLGTLLMGFGAAGAISKHYGLDYLPASLIGLATGVALSLLMNAVLSVFYRQQASSLIPTSSALGCRGTVTVSIEGNGCGLVGLDVQGQYTTYEASSHDGKSIPKGATIRVLQAVASRLVVEKEFPKVNQTE